MFDRAIGIAGLSLAFLFGVLQYYLPQLPFWASAGGLGVGVFLLGVSLGHLWVVQETQSQKPKSVDRARLRLHLYSDHRVPEALTGENIFRWYHLRQMIVTMTPDGTEKATFPMTTLFLTFEPEVRVSTLKVQSPDIVLPAHEVKEFNRRFAIIVFMGELAAGTLEVSVQP